METPTPPMTVEQLHLALGEAIARGQGDQPVQIPYDPGVATLGGQPAVNIKSLFSGFDWDQGRQFLVPEKRLGVPEAALRKRVSKIETIVGRMHLAAFATSGGDDAKRLDRLRELVLALGEEINPKPTPETQG